MRSGRLDRYARPAPSTATVVTPNKIKERAISGRRITRKCRTGKRLPMEQLTPMQAVIPFQKSTICSSRPPAPI
jgi:hypothetical protein